MLRHLSKSLWLLLFAVVICCMIYPAVLWVVGQTVFPFQANGSIVNGPDGQPVGSLLIAQPFTKDEYFQPRPSAASYDASASASSALAASNYMLRNRVATTIGPIAKYKSGPHAGQLVAPDIEAWFQQDRFLGQPHIVAQWADLHNAAAQAWVAADPTHAQYVKDWQNWEKAHEAERIAQFVKDNPNVTIITDPNDPNYNAGLPDPKDVAVVFFEDFSKNHPSLFPAAPATPAPTTAPDVAARPTTAPAAFTEPTSPPTTAPAVTLVLVKEGTDIQSIFFDLWRQDHPDAELEAIPGDMVTTSASGLDPHITLENATFQLDRVAGKWAANLKRDPAAVRKEIEQVLQDKTFAPLGGLAGEKMVNVLEVNLELRKRYGPTQ